MRSLVRLSALGSIVAVLLAGCAFGVTKVQVAHSPLPSPPQKRQGRILVRQFVDERQEEHEYIGAKQGGIFTQSWIFSGGPRGLPASPAYPLSSATGHPQAPQLGPAQFSIEFRWGTAQMPMAETAGWADGRIVVTFNVARLSQRELPHVIAHELHHVTEMSRRGTHHRYSAEDLRQLERDAAVYAVSVADDRNGGGPRS